MTLPPDDLIAFLRNGQQLEYDATNCEIGRIKLKSADDLVRATISIYPGCQSIIDDPYSDLDGQYQVDAFDLVAESEHYDPEGLLCWIPSLKRYGCVDAEHGTVLMFPTATWPDIVANPVAHLDAQWGWEGVDSECALPWIHFPFSLANIDTVLRPYPRECPLHNDSVQSRAARKPELFAVLRRRNVDDWLHQYLSTFPCSGLPLNEDELLFCQLCRSAEDQWLKSIDDAILPVEVTPNAHGWAAIPGDRKEPANTELAVLAIRKEKQWTGVPFRATPTYN